jgi:hypothetical protein
MDLEIGFSEHGYSGSIIGRKLTSWATVSFSRSAVNLGIGSLIQNYKHLLFSALVSRDTSTLLDLIICGILSCKCSGDPHYVKVCACNLWLSEDPSTSNISHILLLVHSILYAKTLSHLHWLHSLVITGLVYINYELLRIQNKVSVWALPGVTEKKHVNSFRKF